MTERFNKPNREQLAAIAGGDNRLIRAFEQLFDAAGQLSPDALDDLGVRVTANELQITANETRIKTNEVLLWLSM